MTIDDDVIRSFGGADITAAVVTARRMLKSGMPADQLAGATLLVLLEIRDYAADLPVLCDALLDEEKVPG